MANMPVLATLLAKIMQIIEQVLDNFVNVMISNTSNECYNGHQIIVSSTDCGTDFANLMAKVVYGVTQIVGQALEGVGAVAQWDTIG